MNVLYYSDYCDNCKKLINLISRNLDRQKISEIKFINIDKRVQQNGQMFAILDNGQPFYISSSIDKVPAMIDLNSGQTLFGNYIHQHLGLNLMLTTGGRTRDEMTSRDPEPYAFEGMSSGIGVISDKYSFCDVNPEDMLAEGNGGLSQLHTYVTLDDYDNGSMMINPKEEVVVNSKPSVDLNILREQREKEIQMQGGPPIDRIMPSY